MMGLKKEFFRAVIVLKTTRNTDKYDKDHKSMFAPESGPELSPKKRGRKPKPKPLTQEGKSRDLYKPIV